MFFTVFRESFLHLLRSTKNRLLLVLLLLGLGFYSVALLPSQTSLDNIDVERLRQELYANKGIMESAKETGKFQVNRFTGQSAYQLAKAQYENQRPLLAAIENGDAERYVTIIQRYMPSFYLEEVDEYYQLNSPFPNKDRGYDFANLFNRLTSYQEAEVPLNFHIIQEKTSWQQIQLFFLNWGPYVLVALTLFIASDLFVLGQKARTQRVGVPYSWNGYLFTQSLAVLTFVLLAFSAAAAFFWLFNGVLYGFGSLEWSVPAFHYSEDFVLNPEVYGLMTIGSFLLQALPYTLLLLYLFIRLTVLLSLFFRQEVLVFLTGLFLLFGELLYLNRTTRSLWGIPISRFPQTYFDYGKVITGAKNFLINTGTITFATGLTVLAITVLIVELGVYLASRRVDRQTFLALGGAS